MSVSKSEVVLHELSEENLLSRAICGARDPRKRRAEKHPRWVAVASTFSLGATYAKELCTIFGFDPYEKVSR